MGVIVLVLAGLSCVGLARRVQVNAKDSPDNGAHDWELENIARHRVGELNDAELGMANLKMAMSDSSLLSEVAEWLRSPDGRARLIKMVADAKFQDQAEATAATMKKGGVLPNLLNLEYYGEIEAKRAASSGKTIFEALEAGAAFHVTPAVNRRSNNRRSASSRMDALDDLKADAKALNPVIGYWDPLGLSKAEFWGQSNEATIGFLRHAEIKHGRVAMAAFVGYCLHENGIRFPWTPFNAPEYEGLSAPAVWESMSPEMKGQILVGIAFFEWWSESSFVLKADGQSHYMRGGKPGYYPTFKMAPHPVPFNLWDPFASGKPFSYSARLSEEAKNRKLKVEINNGRLAMIGIMSLLSEAKVPGSVPALKGLIKEYSGDVISNPLGF
jgi:hypothetical protein